MKGQIVYIDDEEHNLYLFEGIFEDDFNIVTYDSARSLLDDISVLNNSHIVVSDMKMPGMSGIELILALKKQHPIIPCYILSAYPFEKEVSGFIKNGTVKGFFSKPFNTAELLREFEKVIQSQI